MADISLHALNKCVGEHIWSISMLEFRVKFRLEHWQLEHLEICLLGEKFG